MENLINEIQERYAAFPGEKPLIRFVSYLESVLDGGSVSNPELSELEELKCWSIQNSYQFDMSDAEIYATSLIEQVLYRKEYEKTNGSVSHLLSAASLLCKIRRHDEALGLIDEVLDMDDPRYDGRHTRKDFEEEKAFIIKLKTRERGISSYMRRLAPSQILKYLFSKIKGE